jgi:hypothetical protein
MSGLTDREKAFENKFIHDQDTRFKVLARRNKLLGLWAADLLGKADPDAYAKEVVLSDLVEAGEEDVVRKVVADFEAAGVAMTADGIRAKMGELLSIAMAQLQAD